MQKVKLDLDQLTVDSFRTVSAVPAQRGTVRAFSHVCGPTVIDPTCFVSCSTCDESCVYVCP